MENTIRDQIKKAYANVTNVTEIKVTPTAENAYRVNVYSKFLPEGAAWEVSYMVGSHFVVNRGGTLHYNPPLGHHYAIKG